MKKLKRAILLILAAATIITLLTSCGNGLPNGRYEPTDSAMAIVIPAIVIKGKNFSVLTAALGNGKETANNFTYEYKDGTITLTDGYGLPGRDDCFYDKNTKILSYGGVEFLKTD